MARDLAQRAAAQRNGGDTDTPGTDVEQKPATLAQQIHNMRAQFQLAMPRGTEAGQLVRDALTCLRTTRNLANCEADSVLGGLMTCAQLGLRPGVASLGHAWLIPFWDKHAGPKRNGKPMGAHRAQLIIGYRGYTELGYRHPKVISIASRVVYTNDRFKIAYNLDGDVLEHEPFLDGPRGDPFCYYAIARLQGGYALTEPWSQADMDIHRDRYAMAKTKNGDIVGPWKDQPTEMGRKTMIRVPLLKMIPISTDLATAIEVDEGVRVDLTPDADPAEVTMHPTLAGEVEPGAEEPRELAAADAEAGEQAKPADDPLHYGQDEIKEGGGS